jgi:hypothetical protein
MMEAMRSGITISMMTSQNINTGVRTHAFLYSFTCASRVFSIELPSFLLLMLGNIIGDECRIVNENKKNHIILRIHIDKQTRYSVFYNTDSGMEEMR